MAGVAGLSPVPCTSSYSVAGLGAATTHTGNLLLIIKQEARQVITAYYLLPFYLIGPY